MNARELIFVGMALASGVAIGSALYEQGTEQRVQTVAEFPDLVRGLKETPGIIDVKVAVIDGKKQTIFAWFKNKSSVDAWYNSPMHRGAMAKFFPKMKGAAHSLMGFADEKAPILVVASVTPSEKPHISGSRLAVSQIAIEMYTPVPGGVVFGSGFAPDSLDVPGMRRIEVNANSD